MGIKKTMPPLRTAQCSRVMSVAVLGIAAAMAAQAQDTERGDNGKPLPETRVCLTEQLVYNDNLFLNNSSASLAQLGPGVSRSDTVAVTSACANGVWRISDQLVVFDGAIDDHRYFQNDVLNYTGGNAALTWQWRTIGNWYGEIGGNYRRALGSFFNDRPLAKDLVDSVQYTGRINHEIGARLNFSVGAQRNDTTHGAVSRREDNYRSDGVDGVLLFTSRADNNVGVAVQHTSANYPYQFLLNDSMIDRDYTENTESLRFRYAPRDKLTLTGTLGHLKRDYRDPSENGFSGQVWRGTVNWQFTERADLNVSAWKELDAYFDTEADHFVARGFEVGSTWAARDKWNVADGWRWVRQEYITSTVDNGGTVVDATTPRVDHVQIGFLTTSFRPSEHISIDLNLQYERHTSDLQYYGYTDRIVMLRVVAQL